MCCRHVTKWRVSTYFVHLLKTMNPFRISLGFSTKNGGRGGGDDVQGEQVYQYFPNFFTGNIHAQYVVTHSTYLYSSDDLCQMAWARIWIIHDLWIEVNDQKHQNILCNAPDLQTSFIYSGKVSYLNAHSSYIFLKTHSSKISYICRRNVLILAKSALLLLWEISI